MLNTSVKRVSSLTSLTSTSFALLGGFILPHAASAYTLLAPLGGFTEVSSLSQYLGTMFSVFLGVVSVLAVIMLVISGLQYIAFASNESSKGAAKERIRNALFGLLLALATWIILYTINPALTGFGSIGGPLGSGPAVNDVSVSSVNKWYFSYRHTSSDPWQTAVHDDQPSCSSHASLLSQEGWVVTNCTLTSSDSPATLPSQTGSTGGSSGPTEHWCFKFRATNASEESSNCNATTQSGCSMAQNTFAPPLFTITQSCYRVTM
jgi:hypothetical protein